MTSGKAPLPRYYFHTMQGRSFPDHDGAEMVSTAAAHRAAVRHLGEILRDGAADFWDEGPFSIVCVDDKGTIVTGLRAHQMTTDDAEKTLALLRAGRA